jgi:hypothetical protein
MPSAAGGWRCGGRLYATPRTGHRMDGMAAVWHAFLVRYANHPPALCTLKSIRSAQARPSNYKTSSIGTGYIEDSQSSVHLAGRAAVGVSIGWGQQSTTRQNTDERRSFCSFFTALCRALALRTVGRVSLSL